MHETHHGILSRRVSSRGHRTGHNVCGLGSSPPSGLLCGGLLTSTKRTAVCVFSGALPTLPVQEMETAMSPGAREDLQAPATRLYLDQPPPVVSDGSHVSTTYVNGLLAAALLVAHSCSMALAHMQNSHHRFACGDWQVVGVIRESMRSTVGGGMQVCFRAAAAILYGQGHKAPP
jgi:hypothetical protein